MERSQNIRQASVRQIVGTNLALDGKLINPNEEGGVVLGNATACPKCGSAIAPYQDGVCC